MSAQPTTLNATAAGSVQVGRSPRTATEKARTITGARYSRRMAVATPVSEIVLKYAKCMKARPNTPECDEERQLPGLDDKQVAPANDQVRQNHEKRGHRPCAREQHRVDVHAERRNGQEAVASLGDVKSHLAIRPPPAQQVAASSTRP